MSNTTTEKNESPSAHDSFHRWLTKTAVVTNDRPGTIIEDVRIDREFPKEEDASFDVIYSHIAHCCNSDPDVLDSLWEAYRRWNQYPWYGEEPEDDDDYDVE